MPPYGFSFQPGVPSIDVNRPSASPLTQTPQSAVNIISASLPRRITGSPLAPPGLLTAPGGGGLEALLPLLMQLFAPQGQQPGVPALKTPSGGGFGLPGVSTSHAPMPPVTRAPEATLPHIIPGGEQLGTAPPEMPAAPPPGLFDASPDTWHMYDRRISR